MSSSAVIRTTSTSPSTRQHPLLSGTHSHQTLLSQSRINVPRSIAQNLQKYSIRPFEKALKNFTKSIKMTTLTHGPDDIRIVNCNYNMAYIYDLKCDYVAACACLLDALRVYKLVLGDTHVSVANAYHNLGGVMDKRGDYDDALRCYKAALRIKLDLLAEYNDNDDDGEHDCGSSSSDDGDKEEVKVSTDSNDNRDKEKKEDELSLLKTYFIMGINCAIRQSYDDAVNSFQEALRIRRVHLGDDDILVADTLHNLAKSYDARSERDKAMVCFNESLRIKMLNLGSNHYDNSNTLYSMGLAHDKNGNYRGAIDCFEKAVMIRRGEESGASDDDYEIVAHTIKSK